MSFQLLKTEIIDQQLCQGCALCAGICKSIEMKDSKPELTGQCVLEKTGESCGKCYASCPQANQSSINPSEPKAIYSLDPIPEAGRLLTLDKDDETISMLGE